MPYAAISSAQAILGNPSAARVSTGLLPLKVESAELSVLRKPPLLKWPTQDPKNGSRVRVMITALYWIALGQDVVVRFANEIPEGHPTVLVSGLDYEPIVLRAANVIDGTPRLKELFASLGFDRDRILRTPLVVLDADSQDQDPRTSESYRSNVYPFPEERGVLFFSEVWSSRGLVNDSFIRETARRHLLADAVSLASGNLSIKDITTSPLGNGNCVQLFDPPSFMDLFSDVELPQVMSVALSVYKSGAMPGLPLSDFELILPGED